MTVKAVKREKIKEIVEKFIDRAIPKPKDKLPTAPEDNKNAAFLEEFEKRLSSQQEEDEMKNKFTLTNILLMIILLVLAFQTYQFNSYFIDLKQSHDFLKVRHEVLGNKIAYITGRQDEEKDKPKDSEQNEGDEDR